MAINTQNKQYLLDVVLIRLVLIILLVIFHAFAIHTGGWFPPYDTFKPIPAYDWFGMFTHIFQLEAMTFISGLLMGYQGLRKPDSIKSFLFITKKIKRILLPCLIFGIALLLLLIFFMSWKVLREYWQVDMGFAERMTRFIVSNCMNAITVTSAIFLLYGIANKSKVIEFIQHKPILVTLSGYCYGVYIYQEFILRLLYYKTSLPLHIDEYLLPWLAASITLMVSLLLCHVTLRFKFGRFLIG